MRGTCQLSFRPTFAIGRVVSQRKQRKSEVGKLSFVKPALRVSRDFEKLSSRFARSPLFETKHQPSPLELLSRGNYFVRASSYSFNCEALLKATCRVGVSPSRNAVALAPPSPPPPCTRICYRQFDD